MIILLPIIVNETSLNASNRPAASFSYTYDANKNPTSETTGGVMVGYSWTTGTTGYDTEDRLTFWKRTTGTVSREWPTGTNTGLTPVGDWDSVIIDGTTTQTRTHDKAHELTDVGGNSITLDAKGNTTTDDQSRSFVWDFDNRMKSSNASGAGGAASLTFTYDALGRRVSKSDGSATTVYVCTGQQVVSEYVSGQPANSPTQSYVYGSYIDEPLMKIALGVKHYYHTNRQFSVTTLTDSSGVVAERYAYTPYGQTVILAPDGSTVRPVSTINNSYLYTGRRLDKEFAGTSQNTLYFYRARYYDPVLGRFINRDPILYGGGINLYAYVGGYPLIKLDPSGLIGIFFGGAGITVNDNTQIVRLFNLYAGEAYFYSTGVGPKGRVNNIQANITAAKKRVCDAFCSRVLFSCEHDTYHYRNGNPEPVDIFGWSRGGIAAITLTTKLKEDGCHCSVDCRETREELCRDDFGRGYMQTIISWRELSARIRPVEVRFLGLIDPVNTGLLTMRFTESETGDDANVEHLWVAEAVDSNITDATVFGSDISSPDEDRIDYSYTHKKYDLSHSESGRDETIGNDLGNAANSAGVPIEIED